MASNECENKSTCIHDPNFAVVCSFFENFSALCGIPQPLFTDLQQMIDNEDVSPQLVDLHIRLMRKARKNVNQERWQRTLARFCWISQPEDCYILEQKGYKHLNCTQRLRILLTLLGAQFDLNVKFKTDINKLDGKTLRLDPIGRDKNGMNYWAQLDQDANLKIYKEDCDEEKWELIATDRNGLKKLIEDLLKDKDPKRKLEEIDDDQSSEADEEKDNVPNDEENAVEEKLQDVFLDEATDNENNEKNGNEDSVDPTFSSRSKKFSETNSRSTSQRKKQSDISILKYNLHPPVTGGSIKTKKSPNSPVEIVRRPQFKNFTPPKLLNKESLAEHLQKCDSQNMLLPLLEISILDTENSPSNTVTGLLKSKINQKLNTDILKSNLESANRTAKPCLKLEQILKSKLIPKLTSKSISDSITNGGRGHLSSESANSSENICIQNVTHSTDKYMNSKQLSCDKSVTLNVGYVSTEEALTVANEDINGNTNEITFNNIVKAIPKKRKLNESVESLNEFEEPVMHVSGVGNGQDCNNGNYINDEDEIEEAVMFITGVGCGCDCTTGNSENEENYSKNLPNTSQHSHKVDDILRSTPESEQNVESAAISVDDKEAMVPLDNVEKKKPKLWTIDAICNSDSSKEPRRERENVSLFQNYSFIFENKIENPKPYCGTTESYSIFSLTEKNDERDRHSIIPTNFYFGCNNKNPSFLPSETSTNNINLNKSHNVEDLVADIDSKRSIHSIDEVKASSFMTGNLYSKTDNSENSILRVNETIHKTDESDRLLMLDCEPRKITKKKSVSDVSENDTSKIGEKEIHEPKYPIITILKTVNSDEISSEPTVIENLSQVSTILNVNQTKNFSESNKNLTLCVNPSFKTEEDMETNVENDFTSSIDIKKVDNVEIVQKLEHGRKKKIISEQEVSPNFLVIDKKTIKDEFTETNDAFKKLRSHEAVINEKVSSEELPVGDITFENCNIELNTMKGSEELEGDVFKSSINKSSLQNLTHVFSDNVETIQQLTNPFVSANIKSSESRYEQIPEKINSTPFKNIAKTDESLVPVAVQEDRVQRYSLIEEEINKKEKSNEYNDLTEIPKKYFDIDVHSEEAKKLENVDKSVSIVTVKKKVNESMDVAIQNYTSKEMVEKDHPTMIVDCTKESSSDVKTVNDDRGIRIDDGSNRNEETETQNPFVRKTRSRKSLDKEENNIVLEESMHHEEARELEEDINENLKLSLRSKRTKQYNNQNLKEKKTLKKGRGKKFTDATMKEVSAQENNDIRKSLRRNNQRSDVDQPVEEVAHTENPDTICTRQTRRSGSLNSQKINDPNTDVKISSKRGKKKTVIPSSIISDHHSDKNMIQNAEKKEQEQNENRYNDVVEPIPDTRKTKRGRNKKKSIGRKTGKVQKSEYKSEEQNTDEEIVDLTVLKSEKCVQNSCPSEKSPEEEERIHKTAKKKSLKRGWLNEVDVNNIELPPSAGSTSGIRQSRRIAQLKIREQAENKYIEQIVTPKKSTSTSQKSKLVTSYKKAKITPKKYSKYKPSNEESEDETYHGKQPIKKKKKKKDQQPQKNFDPRKAWKQSSESSSEEEEEEDHYEEEDEELVVLDASDHEFSPESDLDDDHQPVKRARTAHTKPQPEDQERDDLSCQSCKKADQPEWILLCDFCDEGWHAACLKPPVMAIPEGDWFCPPCEHNKLITNLQKFLKSHNRALKKRTNELRKKRLEYVGIISSNIIKNGTAVKQEYEASVNDAKGNFNEYSDESTEEEEEPLYQLRVRRQVNVRHRLNEYEELMSSAIKRESESVMFFSEENKIVEILKDEIQTNKLKTTPCEENPDDMPEDEENEEHEDNEKENKIEPVVLQLRNIRKKPPRLTSLDVSSEDDHYSDEDFKGSSNDDQEDDDDLEKSGSDSDDSVYERRAVRRSTRARVLRYDKDFINDNSEDDEEENRKNKQKRKRYSESDSEEDDATWGKIKKNKNNLFPKKVKKKRKRIKLDHDSEEEGGMKRNSRIKFGLDESEDDFLPQRRTRGKRINYVVDNLGSDSEQEIVPRNRNKGLKIESDDEDYVNDEEDQILFKKSIVTDKEDDSDSDLETKSRPRNRKPKELESDDSDSVLAKPSKKVEAPQEQIETTSKKDESTKVNNIDDDVVTKPNAPKDLQVFNSVKGQADLPKDDSQKVNSSASLQVMQTMAQNLSQVADLNQYPAGSIKDSVYAAKVPVPPSMIHANLAEIGIVYENTDCLIHDKYPNPVRIVSPTKIYMPPEVRSPVPYSPQRLQPPALASLNIVANKRTPSSATIPYGPMPMQGAMPPTLPQITQSPELNIDTCPPVSKVNISPLSSYPSPKRRPRGRGKKQLEIEKLQRERDAIESNETMPIHLLKAPPKDMNTIRLPIPFSTISGPALPQPPPPPLPSTTFYQSVPFSQQPLASQPQTNTTTVPAGNTSKRVKITPTRMRVPLATTQRVMRFPRSPGHAAGVYGLHPPTFSVTAATVSTQSGPNDSKPALLPVTVTSKQAKLERQSSQESVVKSEATNQCYHQPSYVLNPVSRGYNHRTEFGFVRKPPPGVYQQPLPVTTSTSPDVISRTAGFTGAAPCMSPNMKGENEDVSSSAYPGTYQVSNLPPSVTSSIPSKSNQNEERVLISSTSTASTTAYSMLYMKPAQSSVSTSPYAPSYYTSSYPAPPSSTQPSVSFSHTVPSSNFQSQNCSRTSQSIPYKSPSSSVSSTDPGTTGEFMIPTSQSNEFQYSGTQLIGGSEAENSSHFEGSFNQSFTFEEENPVTEETTTGGEFGGLVSYFSSQREDDLDA